jgi:hypothetical protein
MRWAREEQPFRVNNSPRDSIVHPPKNESVNGETDIPFLTDDMRKVGWKLHDHIRVLNFGYVASVDWRSRIKMRRLPNRNYIGHDHRRPFK